LGSTGKPGCTVDSIGDPDWDDRYLKLKRNAEKHGRLFKGHLFEKINYLQKKQKNS
jgi:hypothetical protein